MDVIRAPQAIRTSMVSNTDRYTSYRPVVAGEVYTTSGVVTDSAARVTVTYSKATARHHQISCLPVPEVAADRSGCRAAVSTCQLRPVMGWPLLPLWPPPVVGASDSTATMPESRTSRKDIGPGSRQRNSTSWNDASARPTIRTFSCERRSLCGLVSQSPECRYDI